MRTRAEGEEIDLSHSNSGQELEKTLAEGATTTTIEQ